MCLLASLRSGCFCRQYKELFVICLFIVVVYSFDHCLFIVLSKRGVIQITYCICLLLRNSCLRHATVTTRIGKKLYVTGIVKKYMRYNMISKVYNVKMILLKVSSYTSEVTKNAANKEDMKIRKCR